MPEPVSFNHRTRILVAGGIVLAALCFLAGRLSVRPTASDVTSDTTNAFVGSMASVSTPVAPANVPVASAQSRPTSASPNWNEKQWAELQSQPGSPARNAALEAMLEKLAATDPAQAMKLAGAEANLKLREDLVQASLHGWARTSVSNAANWALALPDPNDRERSLSTVFAGAVATSPDAAVRFGESLIRSTVSDDPAEAAEYGNRLIDALCDGGNFEAAAKMAGGNKDISSRCMGEAYSKWAEFQPEQAAQAAAALDDPELREQALQGIVGGWAQADPEALVKFVTQLPADGEKGSLLGQSLQRWARLDPVSASEWINTVDSSPAMGQGVASVATTDSLSPDVAVGWVETVTDPKLRSETTATVLRNWLTTDLPAAKKYFETTKNLLPEDREEIAGVIATLSGQTTPQ